MQKVIIFGNDHTNTLGVIQSLGTQQFFRVAFLWGNKTGLVGSSRYADEIYTAANEQDCIEKMIDFYKDAKDIIPIIACSDSAALALDANRERMSGRFVFEYTSGQYDFPSLFVKENQVRLAIEAGFNVPKTWLLHSVNDIPRDLDYPCIIKPLISCQGAKCDIRLCPNEESLKQNFTSLSHTKDVILQQYIDHDYEISVLGCGKTDGSCIIPVVENKLTLYPKNVGLECVSYIEELKDCNIINPIKNLINAIGYVGLFSVEMMHNKHDNNFYFTEINLRNDGANSMIYKSGVNLPLHFISDVLGLPIPVENRIHEGFYIWDMHHFLSLIHGELSIRKWIKEIISSKGFMTYSKEDKKPFFKQYTNWILSKLKIYKDERYS